MSTLLRLCRQNIKEWESLERGQELLLSDYKEKCTTSQGTHVKTSNQNLINGTYRLSNKNSGNIFCGSNLHDIIRKCFFFNVYGQLP